MTALYSRDPIFAQTPVAFQVNLTAAKTTRSGVTNATQLLASSSEGAWLTRVWARYGDSLATALRVDLYLSPDGTAALPIDSVQMGVQASLGATTDFPEVQFIKWNADSPLHVPAGYSLWGGLSTAFASGIIVCGQGQSFTSPASGSIATA